MKVFFSLLLPLLWIGAIAAAQTARTPKPSFTSVYTDMKKQCMVMPETANGQGGDPTARCTGYGGYRLFMYYSATSATVGVQRIKDGEDVLTLGTDYGAYGSKGEKIEWRMADGKPFAVIMRVWKYKEGPEGQPYAGARTGSTLLVKGLPGWEHIDTEIDGSTPTANVRAREAADADYGIQ